MEKAPKSKEIRAIRWEDIKNTQLGKGWQVNRHDMVWSISQRVDRVGKERDIAKDWVTAGGKMKKRNGSERTNSARWGVEIGCRTQHAYVHKRRDELLYSNPAALGSLSFSRRWRDTKPHSAGSIHSNHIPSQPACSKNNPHSKKNIKIQGHEFSHTITQDPECCWCNKMSKPETIWYRLQKFFLFFSVITSLKHCRQQYAQTHCKDLSSSHALGKGECIISELSLPNSWFLHPVLWSKSISTNTS